MNEPPNFSDYISHEKYFTCETTSKYLDLTVLNVFNLKNI